MCGRTACTDRWGARGNQASVGHAARHRAPLAYPTALAQVSFKPGEDHRAVDCRKALAVMAAGRRLEVGGLVVGDGWRCGDGRDGEGAATRAGIAGRTAVVGPRGTGPAGCVAVRDGLERGGRSQSRPAAGDAGVAGALTRGDGSLFVATRTGTRVLGLSLRASEVPAATWWAHHCGCAWAAAYLQLRERNFIADRELLDDPLWSGRISWTDHEGLHSSGHRPDLVGFLPNGPAVPVEVELAQKSIARLRAIIILYVRWRSEGRIGGVIYVCGDQDGAERIMRVTEGVIGPEWRGLQVRLLDTFREEIVPLGEQHRVARSAEMTANVGTAGSPD